MQERAFILFVRGQLEAGSVTARLAEILFGPAHRLAWSDFELEADREQRRDSEVRARVHRQKATERLREAVQALFVGSEGDRKIAVLADWWMQAALGISPLGTAWRVEEYLAPWLGRPLRVVLDAAARAPALLELHRPLALRRARQRLRVQAEHHQTIKKSPGPELYKEAQDDAFELLRLSEDPARSPPSGFRLLEIDVEEWASEPRNDEELIPQSSVWNNLVKHLRQFQENARAVVKHWTAVSPPSAILPVDFAGRMDGEFGGHAAFARALVYDVVRLTSNEERVPEMLKPSWLLESMAELPGELAVRDRVKLLGLVREAQEADAALAAPPWAAEAQGEIQRIISEITTLEARCPSDAADARNWLAEARSHLDGLDAIQAVESLQIARQEVEAAELELERSRLVAEVEARSAEVGSGGTPLPSKVAELPTDALRALHRSIEETWNHEVRSVSSSLDEIAALLGQLALGEDRARLEAALRDGRLKIREGLLGEAREIGATVRAEIEHARTREHASLGPELVQVAERARKSSLRGPEIASVEALIRRVRARNLAKLPHQGLFEALLRLLEAAERDRCDQLLIVATVGARREGGGTTIMPLAYLETGVAIEPTRVSWTGELVSKSASFDGTTTSRVRIGGVGAWYRKPPRPDQPSELRRDPEPLEDGSFFRPVYEVDPARLDEARFTPHPGTNVFFIQHDGKVLGPYALKDGAPTPADPRGFVADLSAARFFELFGRIDGAPASVHEAPSLDELVIAGAEPVDVDDAVARERWLADVLDDLTGVDVAAVSRLLERLGGKRPLPRPILARRVKDLQNVLEFSRMLGPERRRAAERFLETDEGRREIERAAQKSVESRRAEIEAEVESLRSKRLDELRTVEADLLRARAELESVRGEETAIRVEREEHLADVRKEIAAAEELLSDRKTKLLAQFVGRPMGEATRAPIEDSIVARPLVTRPANDPRAIVNRIASQLSIEPQDAANLLASLLSGPWTLLAGPPGAGKSTLARAFLAAIGHGPGTDRYLELVVRRDWQDDAALFGFWHPEQQVWVPGSEGLLDTLLRAEDDRKRRLGGLYATVLEELNLASPEYYLSRLISALEAREPSIRLYGDDLRPNNSARYPSTVTLGPNVRLIGTVNVDETVERLSPRFLSRASVIWLEPELDAILRPPAPPAPPSDPIHYAELFDTLVPREPIALGPIEEVVSFLHERRIPGAPATRTLTAVRRYLAASRGLLSEAVARDFAVVQRILPSFRGVGPRYGEALEDLARLLRKNGFLRSAERCERLRQRGAELGEYYDFFHA